MKGAIRWVMNGIGKGFGYLIHGRPVGKWAALLLLAGSVHAEVRPSLPALMIGSAAAVATSSISVSVYADHQLEMNLALATTEFFSHGPLKEWSLQVGKTGSTTGYWTVELQVSNDDAVWTTILKHEKANGSGTMVWGDHRTARRARLNLTSIGAGCHVSATAFGTP